MKTKKSKSIRLLSVLLSLVMALGIAVSTMAAEISIVPNEYTTVPGDGTGEELISRFSAYQIFAGKLSEEYSGVVGETKDPNTGYRNPNANLLANITWGSGINGTIDNIKSILTALMECDASLASVGINSENPMLNEAPYNSIEKTTLGDLFKAQIKDSVYWDKDNDTLLADGSKFSLDQWKQSAVVVTSLLNDFTPENGNNAALAEAFAKIIAATDDSGSYKYLSEKLYKSSWNEDAGNWTIDTSESEENNGYYLIVDTYKEEAADKVASDYIVGVFGDSTIYVKSNAPTVDKTVAGEASTPKGSDYEIGDMITFQLKGTLPENYVNFDTYFYEFVDTMSEGLTYLGGGSSTGKDYNDVLSVYVTVPGTDGNTDKYVIGLSETDGYNLTVSTDEATGVTTLTVTFNDLKKLMGKKVGEDGNPAETAVPVPVTKDSLVYVEYTAVLNEKSLITNGNVNDVLLKFSNNPKNNDKGTTHKEYVYAYDFGIDIFKYDGSTESTALSGAGFALTKNENGSTLYALLHKNGDGYYLAGWIMENDLVSLKGVSSTDEITDEDWKEPIKGEALTKDYASYLGENFDASAEYYVTVLTDENGRLNILGLDDEIDDASTPDYTLVETVVPSHYDPLANIPVTFTAEYFTNEDLSDGSGSYPAEAMPGMLKNLTISYTVNGQKITVNAAKDGYWLDAEGNSTGNPTSEPPVDATNPVQTDLLAHMNVPNFPEGWLPGTGGSGVTLIYIAGGLLIAGAAMYLVLSSVKKKKALTR